MQESEEEDDPEYFSDEDSAPSSKRRKGDEVRPSMVMGVLSWLPRGVAMVIFLQSSYEARKRKHIWKRKR